MIGQRSATHEHVEHDPRTRTPLGLRNHLHYGHDLETGECPGYEQLAERHRLAHEMSGEGEPAAVLPRPAEHALPRPVPGEAESPPASPGPTQYIVVEDLGEWLVVEVFAGVSAVVRSRWDTRSAAERDACAWYDLLGRDR